MKQKKDSGKIRPGDRVADDYLGEGTVQPLDAALREWGMVSVLWDTRPHVNYNCGQNPCAAFTHQLRKVEKQ